MGFPHFCYIDIILRSDFFCVFPRIMPWVPTDRTSWFLQNYDIVFWVSKHIVCYFFYVSYINCLTGRIGDIGKNFTGSFIGPRMYSLIFGNKISIHFRILLLFQFINTAVFKPQFLLLINSCNTSVFWRNDLSFHLFKRLNHCIIINLYVFKNDGRDGGFWVSWTGGKAPGLGNLPDPSPFFSFLHFKE